jgi:oligopeptide transport system permease protein
MHRYIIKRVLLAILTVFIIAAITFFAMNAIPGGPFASEKAPSPEVQKALEERYNLDKPVGEQFIIYLKNFLQGDLGVSLKTGRSISTVIGESFPISARLGGMAALIATVIGLILGSIAALKRNSFIDRIIVFVTTLFTAVPSFVLATMLLYIFCMALNWVPVYDANKTHYVLPVIALSLYPMAYITRLTKTSMLDALGQDYVRTANAKGVAMWKVIFKHALRNAVIPVITYVGPMLAYILTGSLVVENIFNIGGLGSKFVSSITNRDYTMIMGTTIFLSVIMVTMNLITDIVYSIVDPRIKLED